MSKHFTIELQKQSDSEEKEEDAICCKTCSAEITSRKYAIDPHEHTFRNPAGYSFHVLCFSHAPGAAGLGEPTSEASWFPDHSWSFAICTGCGNHLGWWYTGARNFAGLIATRLIR